jgi:hypothetical protein
MIHLTGAACNPSPKPAMAFVFSDRDLDPPDDWDLGPDPEPITVWHFVRADQGEEFATTPADRAEQFESFVLSGLSFSCNRFTID